MNKTLVSIAALSILVISYQNCAEIAPQHSSEIELSSSSPEVLSADAEIAMLYPPAKETWDAQCLRCHSGAMPSGELGSFEQYSTRAVEQGLYLNPSRADSGRKLKFTESNGPMPTNSNLTPQQAQSLIDYMAAIKKQRDLASNDISACHSQTTLRYNPQISNLLRNNSVTYEGRQLNCLSCHGTNNNHQLFVGNFIPLTNVDQVRSKIRQRHPEQSILMEAIYPRLTPQAAPYHQVNNNMVEQLAEWIRACAP